MHEVLARAHRPSRWLWVQLVTQLLLLGYWTVTFVRDGDALAGVLSAVFLAAVVLGVVVVGVSPRASLAVNDDELVLDRPWRGVRIRRDAVRAVRGDVAGRPGWSERVVVETTGRTLVVPTLDVPPPALIARLQDWAGVGEQPAPG